MPHNNYIENLLELKDPNLKIDTSVPIINQNYKGKFRKVLHATLSPHVNLCTTCGSVSKNIIKHGSKYSTVKINTVNETDTVLKIKKQRYLCKECNSTFTATTSLVNKNCNLSKPLKLAILMKARECVSEKSIANEFNVSHQTVHNIIHTKYFQFKTSFNYLPSFLSFDEFKSTKDAKGAMSFIVTDPLNKEVIDIVEDRKLPTLIRYFHRYKFATRKKVKAIVMDMYSPYISLIKTCFPNAKIIFDKFHIIQHLSRALNKMRIKTMKKYSTDSSFYKLIKKYWKLFLKDKTKLSSEIKYNYTLKRYISEDQIIEMILELDNELAKNWNVYQNLLYTFKNRDYNRFCNYLDIYKNKMHDYLNTAINTFIKYKDYIKNTFMSSLSNGFIEGINNKIKLIKRVSFGYRSFVNLRTRVMLQFSLTKKIAVSNISV